MTEETKDKGTGRCKFSIEDPQPQTNPPNVCALVTFTDDGGHMSNPVNCDGEHCDKLNCPKWNGRNGGR